jgi:hypothetical protein
MVQPMPKCLPVKSDFAGADLQTLPGHEFKCRIPAGHHSGRQEDNWEVPDENSVIVEWDYEVTGQLHDSNQQNNIVMIPRGGLSLPRGTHISAQLDPAFPNPSGDPAYYDGIVTVTVVPLARWIEVYTAKYLPIAGTAQCS